MNPQCKAGLRNGTITTPSAGLRAMGSKILLETPESGSSTLRPPFDVACDEYLRQSALFGERSGSSMPMMPTDSSPEDKKVRPAFSPSRPRLRPCAWYSQLLAAIGFDPKKRAELVFIAHYPSPNAEAQNQLNNITKPKVDASLAAMAMPSVVAGEVAKLAILARTGSELGAPLGNSTLLPGGGLLNGFVPPTMLPFLDTTMLTNAQLGAENVVPQPFLAAGLVLAGVVCQLCGLSTASSAGARLCQLSRCSRLHSLRVCSAPRCSRCRPAAAACAATPAAACASFERIRPLLVAQNTDPASVAASRACLRSLITTSSMRGAIVYGGQNWSRLERELRDAWRKGHDVAVEVVEADEYRKFTKEILEATTGLVSPVDCAGSHGKIFIVQMQDGHVMICLQLEALL